ncbi:DUF6446 family protein [Ruegeria sp. 2012CJ41-6]|uniref:DUF6446 family protein n=1 Tax=Ruegeria spongiae TaxID=2942209 RepID=A0ABT0Q3K9_9RHOB|nr:DUF6446 family protein [Ruegeria spongiae]MCL6284377.1 DUF6446 family protein [Ruegeria spongiae]
MKGKLLAIVILVSAAAAGGLMYYMQIYGFYYDVEPQPGRDVALLPIAGETPQAISYSGFRAIDADSSPIRYRACFETDQSLDELSAAFRAAEGAEPLTTPGWFDCFDEQALAEALSSGAARAYLGAKNIHYGVDRIVAVTKDGKGYVWHALNDCGRKSYDGTVVGEACPPRPEAAK